MIKMRINVSPTSLFTLFIYYYQFFFIFIFFHNLHPWLSTVFCSFLQNSHEYGLGSLRKTPVEDTPPIGPGPTCRQLASSLQQLPLFGKQTPHQLIYNHHAHISETFFLGSLSVSFLQLQTYNYIFLLSKCNIRSLILIKLRKSKSNCFLLRTFSF